MRLFYQRVADDCAVLQHILQIDKIAVVHVLCEIIGVMKVDYALVVSIHYIRRKQYPVCDITADLACHVVTLNAVYSRVLVGVFLLYLFVVALYQREYLVIGRV